MVMRLSGLVSGMDTETMVKKLMQVERTPLDKLEQNKQLLEWQRDDYRNMNLLLKELDDLIFNGVGKEGSFVSKKVSSSDTGVVDATASADAPETTVQLDVTTLAKSSSWESGTTVASTWKVSDVGGLIPAGEEEVTLNFKVVNPEDGVKSDVSFTIHKDDKISDVIEKINKSDLGVTAMKGKFNGNPDETIVFTNNKTGSGAEIEISDATTLSLMKAIGFDDGNPANDDFDADGTLELRGFSTFTDGVDAVYSINGFQTTSKSNQFTVNGITYTLKDELASATITTTNDDDKAFDTIVKFIEKYNEIIGKINDKIDEKRYRDYLPLTEEQKGAMEDRQIELWEEKAKSGTLSRSSILTSGLNDMRFDVYSKVEGANEKYDDLSEIGIITSKDYLQKGKLEINEDKLKKAIKENPEAVYQLFNKKADDPVGSMSKKDRTSEDQRIFDKQSGIAVRLRDTIDDTITNIVERAGNIYKTNQNFTIGKELIDVNDRILAFEKRLVDIEDRYWRQFTAMETALQKANEQSGYLMQQFGGGM